MGYIASPCCPLFGIITTLLPVKEGRRGEEKEEQEKGAGQKLQLSFQERRKRRRQREGEGLKGKRDWRISLKET